MGALSFTLPFTVFLHLLPSLSNAHDFGRVATTVAEQLNNIVDIIGVPKELHDDNGEIEFEFVDGSLNPLVESRPVVLVKDPTKLNVGFQAKVESKNLPLSPIRGGISTNVQLANQAKWLPSVLLDESKASKELSSEEEWIESRNPEENRKNATVFHLYVPDVKDILRDKFAKASMQLGLDVGVTSKKDTDENANKIDAFVVDYRSGGKKNYIRLCKKITDGSSLMQKLRGDCVKLPRSEFYVEPITKNANWRKDDTVRLVGLKIGKAGNRNSESGSNEYKLRRMTDGFNDKIANLLRDGKLSLSASTALKV